MGLIVLACGCFDPLHPGHVAHLKAARALGASLTVALTGDEYVNKGVGRPLIPWEERAMVLRELRCVDRVVRNRDVDETISIIRPHIYVKGKEYDGKLPESEICNRLGVQVVYLETKPVYSSTRIINGDELRERTARSGGA